MTPYKSIATLLWSLIWFVTLPAAIVRGDDCDICGEHLNGRFYLVTDKLTGKEMEVCSNCEFHLPRCYLCGLPIKAGDEIKLPDGRYLCARDGATAVLDARQAQQVCSEVKDDLDHLFSRFTSFPDNVDVNVIDRIDVDSMYGISGHDFESPDLLGCIEPVTNGGVKRYHMSLMIGLPLSEMKETCAHEYSHAWVGENVPRARHRRIDRDAEEGFCEMMGYLLMDSQGEEGEKQRVLKNSYTRGQVQLFIAAEQQYGFEDVLDWMRFGVTSRLTDGHLDEINDVEMPSSNPQNVTAPTIPVAAARPATSAAAPTELKLGGIIYGNSPSAVINGQLFFSNDVNQVMLGRTNVVIRCQTIQPDRVKILNLASGQEQELVLPKN